MAENCLKTVMKRPLHKFNKIEKAVLWEIAYNNFITTLNVPYLPFYTI